jgi:riboflavin synthase
VRLPAWQGFVAVDGCSLTVGEVTGDTFNVWLIPETLRATTFGDKRVGDLVNVELDAQTVAIVDTVERVLAAR